MSRYAAIREEIGTDTMDCDIGGYKNARGEVNEDGNVSPELQNTALYRKITALIFHR